MVITQTSDVHVPRPADTVHTTSHTGLHAPVLNIATAVPLRDKTKLRVHVREAVRTGQGFVLDFSDREDTSTIVQVTQNDNLNMRSKVCATLQHTHCRLISGPGQHTCTVFACTCAC